MTSKSDELVENQLDAWLSKQRIPGMKYLIEEQGAVDLTDVAEIYAHKESMQILKDKAKPLEFKRFLESANSLSEQLNIPIVPIVLPNKIVEENKNLESEGNDPNQVENQLRQQILEERRKLSMLKLEMEKLELERQVQLVQKSIEQSKIQRNQLLLQKQELTSNQCTGSSVLNGKEETVETSLTPSVSYYLAPQSKSDSWDRRAKRVTDSLTDHLGHPMKYVESTPNLFRQLGVLTHWSCDLCGRHSNKVFGAPGEGREVGRMNCADCDLDVCLPCFDFATAAVNSEPLIDALGHPMSLTLHKNGTHNIPPGYNSGWLCDLCGLNSNSFAGPSGVTHRFFCGLCKHDICVACQSRRQNDHSDGQSDADDHEDASNS